MTVVVDSVDPVDWEVIVGARPNVLLCGDDSFVDALLALLLPQCRLPIHKLPRNADRLQSFTPPTGTVLMRRVDTYTPDEQQAVLDWLEHDGDTVQLISTTDGAITDLIERGEFLEELFYCLNVVFLDLGCPIAATSNDVQPPSGHFPSVRQGWYATTPDRH